VVAASSEGLVMVGSFLQGRDTERTGSGAPRIGRMRHVADLKISIQKQHYCVIEPY
jgi:hypothetical protein